MAWFFMIVLKIVCFLISLGICVICTIGLTTEKTTIVDEQFLSDQQDRAQMAVFGIIFSMMVMVIILFG